MATQNQIHFIQLGSDSKTGRNICMHTVKFEITLIDIKITVLSVTNKLGESALHNVHVSSTNAKEAKKLHYLIF